MTRRQIKNKIVKLIKKPRIYYETLAMVEDKLWQRFGDLCEDNMSINENWPVGSINPSELTGNITVAMSDLFEKNLAKLLNKELKQYGYSVVKVNNSVGDLVITHIESGKKFPFELKTTQGDSFQGSTHSASKCEDYILLAYKVDRNLKLSMDDNSGFFTNYSSQVFPNMDNVWWYGKETESNSRTTLKVPIVESNDWDNSFIIGSPKPITRSNTKYCAGIMELLTANKWFK